MASACVYLIRTRDHVCVNPWIDEIVVGGFRLVVAVAVESLPARYNRIV
jgi:hypothetical protein